MKSMRLCATLILSAMTAATVRVAAQSSPPTPSVPPPAAPASPVSGPMIQVDNTEYDFGKAPMGELVRHTYFFTNTGNETLQVTNVRPGCHCTTVGDWTHSVAPGQSGRITVQFDTAGLGDSPPLTKIIHVFSNAKNQPQTTLLLKGSVWKPLDVTPTLAMINIPADATNEMAAKVRIVNNTDQPVAISNVISSNQLFRAALIETKPGNEYELVITAQPPFATGRSSGTITFNTSLPSTPSVSVTVVADVAPAITVYPTQLVLNSLPDRWTTNRAAIHPNTTNVLVLSNPKASDSQIHVEVQPYGTNGRFFLVASFPPGFHIEAGQHPEVSVESNDPRFALIKLPIVEYGRPALPPHPKPSQGAGHP